MNEFKRLVYVGASVPGESGIVDWMNKPGGCIGSMGKSSKEKRSSMKVSRLGGESFDVAWSPVDRDAFCRRVRWRLSFSWSFVGHAQARSFLVQFVHRSRVSSHFFRLLRPMVVVLANVEAELVRLRCAHKSDIQSWSSMVASHPIQSNASKRHETPDD